MQYYKNDDWYEVIRITGPTHNLLGLRISDQVSDGTPDVEAISGHAAATPQFESALREQVMAGVEQANAELATDFHVAAIRYLGSDTLDLATYRYLAERVIARVAKRGDFIMR
jgi:hypothetical protein